jgi:hypothetical protein
MKENQVNAKEISHLEDIASGIISQLEYFKRNYNDIENKLSDQNTPVGLTDNEAIIFNEQKRVADILYREMKNLANEPFISWIKIHEDDRDQTILISRNYTPNNYEPLDTHNVSFASKQSPYAAQLFISRINEPYNFKRPDGKFVSGKILYRDRYFIPRMRPVCDGVQNTIDLESGTYSIDSLLKIIKLRDIEITDDISQIVKDILKEADIVKGIRRSIIDSIYLRDQPILDEHQIKIYRSPLASNLIITGSAGTGKTTVLINRISLATKPDNLTEEEKEGIRGPGIKLLNERNDNWVLYTPTDLLKMYLQQAFNKESIPAYDKTIKVWQDERMDIARNILKFLKVGDRGIFVRTRNDIFLPGTNKEIVSYANKFQEYYSNSIIEKYIYAYHDISKYKDNYEFVKNFRNVKRYYDEINVNVSFDAAYMLITRLHQLRDEYTNFKDIVDNKLDSIVENTYKMNSNILADISTIIKMNSKDGDISDEELDDDTPDIDDTDELQNKSLTKDDKARAYQQLRRAVVHYAERKARSETISAMSINGQIIEKIKLDLTTYGDQLLNIGKERLILRVTNLPTAGYIHNFIRRIPNAYLEYRNKVFTDESQVFFNNLAIRHVKDKKYISDHEIDILIFIILKNVSHYFDKNRDELANPINNSLLESIKSIYKNIVTVDESSDFNAITLGCMYYLTHPFVKSFTLTGDLMQRVTEHGITSWNDCSYFLSDYNVQSLNQVYRQSKKLLNIASMLYERFVGEKLELSIYADNENEPDPIIFQRNDDGEYVNWIVNRIIEVYNITDGKATIALFVSDDSDIDPLYDMISEPLAENNLQVEKCKDGKILSTDSKIRIFSVEYIKGLEFEAVFFLDIDDIYLWKPNLIEKYLYVGLTRAGSFLGVTYKIKFPETLEFIRECFVESDWSWLVE